MTHFTRLQKAHQTERRETAMETRRVTEEKKRNAVEEKENGKLKSLQERLHYTPQDEASFLAKIRTAAQAFNANAGLDAVHLQTFKSIPTLHVSHFKTLIQKTLHSKYSYPELGVLLRWDQRPYRDFLILLILYSSVLYYVLYCTYLTRWIF